MPLTQFSKTYRGKKVLITGHTGQIAYAVAGYLASRCELWGLARYSKPDALERTKALGVTPDDIQSTLGLAFGGQQVSQIYATTDQYQVVLELLPQYQLDYTGLSRLYLKGTGGSMVPLTAVTTISRRTMPPSIRG